MMETEKIPRQELSTEEASQLSGLSRTHITHLLRQGKLKGRNFGHRLWIVDAASLEHYLAIPHKSGPKGPRKKIVQESSQNARKVSTDTQQENGAERNA